MKNLYDRLSPENQDKLKQEFEKFPNTINTLIDELKSNVSYIELTYYTIGMLVSLLNLENYGPIAISEIFEI